MAITVQDGRPWRCFTLVGDDTPRFEVPNEIDVNGLADAFNALLDSSQITDEVTGFNLLIAAAFNSGVEHGRTLAGVA